MNSLLIDTNVLVYSTNYDSKFFTEANEFITESKYELFTTSKNLSEYLAVVTRSTSHQIEPDIALELIENLTVFMKIIYPSEISFSIFKNLIKSYKPSGLRIHDFEIVSIALANEINSIFTYNTKDFAGIKEIRLVTA